MAKKVLGVIGGSGFYQMPGLENVKQLEIGTPFGPPSDPYVTGRIGDLDVVFLARHGKGHRILPSELNYRANIYGMKTLGVDHLLSVSTAGSMKEAIKPGDLVVPNQFLDHTHKRPATFFGDGIVAHVSMADPVCADLARDLAAASRQAGATIHEGGTYLCIEGPQFSSRAESNLYRGWGVDVISMTAMQEARLAKEAELCYAALVLVTDYDCWHPQHDSVTVDQIVAVLLKNAENATKVVRETVAAMPGERRCKCGSALAHATLTDPKKIPAATKKKLKLILGKYVG